MSNPWERSTLVDDVRPVVSRYTKGAYPSSMHLMAQKRFCLCMHCDKFSVGKGKDRDCNCPIANDLYELCVRFNLITPVAQCESFVEAEDG